MTKTAKAVFRFAKAVWREERGSEPGRINLIGLIMAYTMLVALELGNLLEPAIRVFNSNYNSGAPPPLAVVAMFFGGLFMCLIVVGVFLVFDSGHPSQRWTSDDE